MNIVMQSERTSHELKPLGGEALLDTKDNTEFKSLGSEANIEAPSELESHENTELKSG